MKKHTRKDYFVAALALLPLVILWAPLFIGYYGMMNRAILFYGTSIAYAAILGTIAFKRLPKREQKFIEKNFDLTYNIKKDFYDKHCASCTKTCGGVETLDVAKCPYKVEFYEAKYELSQQLSAEEDRLSRYE